VREGALAFAINDDVHTFGDGRRATGVATVRVLRRRVFNRALSQGNLGLGEAYMDGDWIMEQGAVSDLLGVFLRNRLDQKVRGDTGTLWQVAKLQLANLLRGRQWDHVQQHYDIGDDLFACFLDTQSMMYSCGYALTPTDTPEQLQFQKLDRICAKLELTPNDHLLDIGCGFGGLLMHATNASPRQD